MASIFKRTRDRDERKSCYYIDYTDRQGVRRRKKGYPDKKQTIELASKLENENGRDSK